MRTKALIAATSLSLFLSTLPGCGVVRGIFKAGMWTGIIIIALIVGLVIVATRMFRR